MPAGQAADAVKRDKATLNGEPVMGESVDDRDGMPIMVAAAAADTWRLVGVVVMLGTCQAEVGEGGGGGGGGVTDKSWTRARLRDIVNSRRGIDAPERQPNEPQVTPPSEQGGDLPERGEERGGVAAEELERPFINTHTFTHTHTHTHRKR